MAKRYADGFLGDGGRIATTGGLTTAQQLMRGIDEGGGASFHQIWGLGCRC